MNCTWFHSMINCQIKKASRLLFTSMMILAFIVPTEGQEVHQWSVYEITLEAKQTVDNPYVDRVVQATFTSPQGETTQVKGFWVEENQYKVRFTPSQVGQYRYTVSSQPEDSGLQATGILNVGEPNEGHRGFVRVDTEHPYHFVYDDGTRYFMWGTTYYDLILNALAGERWKVAIDSALVFGINKIRCAVTAFNSEKTPYPMAFPFEANAKQDSLNFDRLNPTYWQAIDRVVEYAYQRGMNVDLILYGNGYLSFSGDMDRDKRYVRYLLARYAAYPNVLWCLVNEWNYRYRDSQIEKSYWEEIGNLIYREDPFLKQGDYTRPLSIHQQTRVDFQFFDSDWVTHAIVQVGVRNKTETQPDEWLASRTKPYSRYGDAWGNYSIVFNLGHEMPVVNDEYGYIGEPNDVSEPPHQKENSPALTREKHRHIMWGIVLAGGYGSAGDKNQYKDGYPYFSANWHSDPAEYQDIKHLVDFFASGRTEYWKMKSHNDLITSGERTYALAEPGQQYLFYAATGGTFTAQLHPGKYQAQLYNPRTGENQDYGELTGKEIEFKFPDEQDWVLSLRLLVIN